MRTSKTQRVCVDQHSIRALQKEGIGWGHDLDCGCFHVERSAVPEGPVARFRNWMKKGIV